MSFDCSVLLSLHYLHVCVSHSLVSTKPNTVSRDVNHKVASGFKSLLLASGNFRLDSLYVLTSSCVDDQGMFLRAYISGGTIVRTEKVSQSETEDIYTDDLRLLRSASFNSHLTSVRSERA